MALKNGKPNPLNYFKMRRVEFSPPHFKYTTLNEYNPTLIRLLDKWILNNLNNRYYIGQDVGLDADNNIIYTTKLGFESEKDLSFFKIACPHLNTR